MGRHFMLPQFSWLSLYAELKVRSRVVHYILTLAKVFFIVPVCRNLLARDTVLEI
jgi:hypothetical protein